MQSPVAILQKQRQYRASSYSQGNPPFGMSSTSSGTTPSSLSSSFIDHAFDHPTPTSFSQLQLLSSSVLSNDGSDYTHRVPKVEEQFCSGFNCCGLELDDLHHLLEHFEECHVLPGGGSTPANPSAAAAIAAATGGKGVGSSSGSGLASGSGSNDHDADTEGGSDMPDFDDFDAEHDNTSSSLQPNAAAGSNLPGSSGIGPTLSAPPSPALSSYSDHHSPSAMNANNDPLYELKTKRRGMNNSNSSFPSYNSSGSNNNNNSQQQRTGRTSSRSPPSDYDDSNIPSMSEHDNDHLPFTRRHRQQSVDSLASVSTNASTSSKKRNFNTALGAAPSSSNNNGNNSSNNVNIAGTATNPANIPAGMQGHQPSKPSLTGLDFANIRGGNSGLTGRTSGFSTPDSSVPGTPASEHEGIEMPGVGCVPPSLLFPLRHSQNPYSSAEEDMTTDDDDDDDDARSNSYASEDDGFGNSGATADEVDENIRFQHQLLQQQQMLYGGSAMGNVPLNGLHFNGNGNNNNNFTNNGIMNPNNGMAQRNMSMMQMQNAAGMMLNQNGGFDINNNHFANMLGTTPTAEPMMKKKKTTTSSGGAVKPKKKSSGTASGTGPKQQYDPSMDHAAAAMFSPLTLQHQGAQNNNNNNGTGANIPMPTISASTSPTSQVAASAATLAAIQAAAAANAFPDASTPTGRVWIPNNAKPFKCPVIGCDKAYKQQNGLKYHRLHGHCNANSTGEEIEEEGDKEEDKPFGCYIGPACGKKYKNMNGLRYHYQHSGAHGQIGLQMLTNGTHPPPAYPPGHKRAGLKSYGAEFSNNPSPTVIMNQSTAEAILAAISQTQGPLPPMASPGGGNGGNAPSGNYIGNQHQQQQQQQQQPQLQQQQQHQQQQQQIPLMHGNSFNNQGSRPGTPVSMLPTNIPMGQHA